MKGFSKQELKVIAIVLGIISVLCFFNFRISLRRARDGQRISDLGQMKDYLNAYHEENGEFPLSLTDLHLIDPDSKKGVSYLYLSDGWVYQIYAALEGKDEAEYKEIILARNLSCGNRICNAGKADGKVPLDKSIEEYQNEIKKENEARIHIN